MSEQPIDVGALERTIERERRARAEAERLLETKSADLYAAYEKMADLADSLSTRERYVTAILDAAQDGIMVVDGTGRVDAANPAAANLFGQRVDDLIGCDIGRVLSLSPQQHRTTADLLSALDRQRVHDGWSHRPDGSDLPVSISVGSLTADGLVDADRRILVIHDLTEERAAADALRRTALQDLLTGLGNRAALIESFQPSEDLDAAVVAIDLNRFRRINDSLGRHVGDEVLRIVADRLKQPFEKPPLGSVATWAVARIGADEFAVVVQGDLTDDELGDIVEYLRSTTEKPIQVDGFTISLETCIGFSRIPVAPEDDSASTVERALDRAVIALEHTRRRVGQRVSAYHPDMGAERARVLAIEERIRQGLEDGEFVAYFQPRVDVSTGRVVAGEALVRWDSPDRGLLLPGAFLPVAEQSSLIIAIGEVMFEHVLRLQTQCMERGLAVPISVNLSNHEFALPSVVDRMKRMAGDADVPTNLIEIELQESVIMDDLDYSAWMLRRLSEEGFLVALDDFGVGQSSLGRLRTLPSDVLKLDRSFVNAVPEDPQSTEILKAMVRLAEAVRAAVVVEGVESESQLMVVREAGNCEVQGFFFSPAVPPDRFEELLRTQPWEIRA